MNMKSAGLRPALYNAGLKPALLLMLLLSSASASQIWIDVPFVKQKQNGCGVAVISMVMQYWNKQISTSEIERALYSEDAGGIYASGMKQYFEEHGFRTFAFTGTWQDLEHHLTKGRPMIAALRAGGSDRFHYVVVAGVDSQENIALLNDPAERKLLKMHRSDFEEKWDHTKRWLLLAVPKNAN